MSARDLEASIASTIDRLKHLAAAAGDSLLLADGPVQPDHLLLETCADALTAVRRAEAFIERWRADRSPVNSTEEMRLLNEWKVATGEAKRLMRIAGKIKATTPAGIYAKALLVRGSRTGAEVLAMSLAAELIASPAIRASIWPADTTGGA